jgi:hypothetical protein
MNGWFLAGLHQGGLRSEETREHTAGFRYAVVPCEALHGHNKLQLIRNPPAED